MEKLPLKIRVDIRDLYAPSTSSVNKGLTSLSDILGKKIVPEVEWPALWTESKDDFLDKEGFVSSVISVIVAWCDRLSVRLTNDNEGEWTDDFLERLSQSSSETQLHVQPNIDKVDRPATRWADKCAKLTLYLPKGKQLSGTHLFRALDEDLAKLGVEGSEPTANEAVEDEWAEVTRDRQVKAVSGKPKTLPSLDSLPHPRRILSGVASPFMIVDISSSQQITLQGSDQTALELLRDYLLKWEKKDVYNKLKAEMREDAFCFGMSNCLFIGPANSMRPFDLNPVLVLAFVEDILGYHRVEWQDRRLLFRR